MQNLARVRKPAAFAEERGYSLLELAFGSLLSQDGVALVITGTTTSEQVERDAQAGSRVASI